MPNNRHVRKATADAASDVCKQGILFYEKRGKKQLFFFHLRKCSGIYFYFRKMRKSVLIMYRSPKIAGSIFWKLFEVFILYA